MKALSAGLMFVCAAAHAQVTYTWTDVTPGGSTGHVDGVVVHPLDPGRIIARGLFGFNAVAMSDDGGASWRTADAKLTSGYPMFAHPGIPGMLFMHPYRSTDFGRTWSVLNVVYNGETTVEPIYPIGSDPLDVHHLYGMHVRQDLCGTRFPFFCRATTIVGMVESRDDGSSWSSTGLPERSYINGGYSRASAPTPSNPNRLYATNFNSELLESRDRAATWAKLEIPLRWIVLDPVRPNVMYGYRYYYDFIGHNVLLRTDDGGVTWHNVFESYVGLEPPTIDPARSRVLWIGWPQETLFRSEDAGESWQQIPYPELAPPRRAPAVATIVPSSTEPGVVYLVYANALFRGVPSARPDPVVVEFQYEGDRYWSTPLDGEAVSQSYRLDNGQVSRTALKWGAWNSTDAPAGAAGSCRFWPKPASGLRTRVLVQQGFECEILKRDASWTLEAENEFFTMPVSASGGCAGGFVPVHRFHNGKADVNHRWVADDGVAAEMRTRGWYDEGVRFCARALGRNE